jgi:PIN domain nuclease of toxin-antitoxin system
LALLLDTHVLVWAAADDARLKARTRDALANPETPLFVSAVVAWEYADLEHRGKFKGSGPLGPLLEQLDVSVLDFPADLWTLASTLPQIHRDPVDRMLIAHAMTLGMPLVTADRDIRSYPVETIW